MLHPDDILMPLLTCSAARRKCFDHIVDEPVSDESWDIGTIPTRHGGIVLADACLIRSVAAICAAHDTTVLLTKVHKVNGLSFCAKMMCTLKAQPYLLKSIGELNAAALLLHGHNRW